MVHTAETYMDSAQNDLEYGFDLDICYAKPSILDSLYWQDILKIHEFKRRDVDTFAFMYGTKKLWEHVHYPASLGGVSGNHSKKRYCKDYYGKKW